MENLARVTAETPPHGAAEARQDRVSTAQLEGLAQDLRDLRQPSCPAVTETLTSIFNKR